jgi:hypothetical protein
MYRLGEYIEVMTPFLCFLQKLSGGSPTGKENHLHFGILLVQRDCQLNAIHSGELHIYDCELRNPFLGFQQCDSRFSGLDRAGFVSRVREYDGEVVW